MSEIGSERQLQALLTFKAEQQLFRRQAASETGKAARGADDAVAWGDDRNGVATIGGADRPDRRRLANLDGDVAVAAGFAEGDGQQGLPDPDLEVSPREVQFQLETTALAGEVFQQLTLGFLEDRMLGVLLQRPQPHPIEPLVFPEDGRQPCLPGDEDQLADGDWMVLYWGNIGDSLSKPLWRGACSRGVL